MGPSRRAAQLRSRAVAVLTIVILFIATPSTMDAVVSQLTARRPPILPTAWAGYVGARGGATCAAPHCVGYQAHIMYLFQWNGPERAVYGLGSPQEQLRCTISPVSFPATIQQCRTHKVTRAQKYVSMFYAVSIPVAQTHRSAWQARWLRLDYYADGHTSQSAGVGTVTTGPQGVD